MPSKRFICSLIGILLLPVLAGCIHTRTQTAPQPSGPAIIAKPMRKHFVPLDVDIMNIDREVSIRKVRFATLHTGERRSVQRGEDLLRVGRYDEEILQLPKLRASRDFRVVLEDDQSAPDFLDGYSNVTYECLSANDRYKTLLLGGLFGMLAEDGRLGSTFYLPTREHGIYKAVTGRVEPSGVWFKRISRTRVLPKTEKQYALRYLGKQGMQLEFEIRELCGGSRPRITKRAHIFVPLGTPQAEVAGHLLRIHTATPELLDVTLLR